MVPCQWALYDRWKLLVVADEDESATVEQRIENCRQRHLRCLVDDAHVKRATTEHWTAGAVCSQTRTGYYWLYTQTLLHWYYVNVKVNIEFI